MSYVRLRAHSDLLKLESKTFFSLKNKIKMKFVRPETEQHYNSICALLHSKNIFESLASPDLFSYNVPLSGRITHITTKDN